MWLEGGGGGGGGGQDKKRDGQIGGLLQVAGAKGEKGGGGERERETCSA